MDTLSLNGCLAQYARPLSGSCKFRSRCADEVRDGWSVGYSGNILADWKNSEGSDYTVPIGLAVSKVTKLGKLPVRFQLAVQWLAVQPGLPKK